ncbi:MAG: efflux RND transporter periplasmic adaptor subunit [Gammaproteobacteria bacterium]|nr:efflux RND transporter periplasmic adaptor subunit [Gammaproteobacteria bacterium]
MADKASLLDQLRIDRGAPTQSGGGRRGIWVAGGVTGLVVIVVVGWLTLSRPGGIPVRVAVAAPAPGSAANGAGTGASMLDASGYVVARRQATVSSKVTGKVVEISIEEGQQVEINEVMARLDDSNARAAVDFARAQLQQSEASLAAARTAYENAKPLHERNADLVGKGFVSQTDFENSKASYDASESGLSVAIRAVEVASASLTIAQRALDDTVVRAPFAGVVTVKAAQPGEIVSPISAGGGFTRTGIGTIVDMDSLEVEVDVSENFISRVHAGQPATIKLNAYPDWTISGEIIAVIPTADRAKATVKVRVGFEKKDPRILPQMGARVSFLDNAAPATAGAPRPAPGVLVQADAVQASGETGVVFVIRANKLERRTVRLGARNGDEQTILSGLSSGDRLAVGDFTKFGDGAEVHIE